MVRLLRPRQWTKNLLAFAAWLFTAKFSDGAATLDASLAFVALCLVSSASYALNDVLDAPADRSHPVKRRRPVAAGQVSPAVALAIGAVCLAGGLFLAFWVGALGSMLAFVGMQAIYNLGLKRLAVADVMGIGLAFVQRAVVGAQAIDVGVSGWLLVCTFALAMLIGFGKRRQEYVEQQPGEFATRATLAQYSKTSIDAMVVVSASLATVSYALYVLESETARAHPGLLLTAVPVVFAVLRYLQLILSKGEGGEPESLVFSDPPLVGAMVLYLLLAILAMVGLELPIVQA